MAAREFAYSSEIESRFPGLIWKIRDLIRRSERAYERTEGSAESFLWEHTTHVASLAHRLAQAEKRDPLLPVIAALFHDAGKFAHGRYHEDDTAEEAGAAAIARRMLAGAGMKQAQVQRVVAGLNALYREGSRRNTVADLVHDADFLSKFGSLGVAIFFVKSALRGRTIRTAVLQYLSKELTYAACLPRNMRTVAGRRFAAREGAGSIRFFRSLLVSLQDAMGSKLAVKKFWVPYPSPPGKRLEIHLVSWPACPKCGGRWLRAWSLEDGVKCHKLQVELACCRCSKSLETSFCLPEIASG